MSMSNYPVVYVEREIMRKNSSGVSFPVGYIVSKAFLKSATTRYCPRGNVVKEYEVQYVGYDIANAELYKNGNKLFIAMGDFVKKSAIYEDPFSCKRQTSKLNEELLGNEDDYDEVGPTVIRIRARLRTLIDDLEKGYLEIGRATSNDREQALNGCKQLNKEIGERTFGD